MNTAFSHIKSWIFDLDNTLYPSDCGLFSQIDERMGAFISEYFQVDLIEARRIQKKYFRTYGTTLNGLMEEHGVEPDTYLDYVHNIDHTPIKPDPALKSALDDLPGEKIIYTNASVRHSKKVMERLGIAEIFTQIHDIAASEYAPKPYRPSYERLIEQTGISALNSIMFEDMACNLEVAHDMGMITVLVKTADNHPDGGFGLLGTGDEPYVNFTTDNLAGFLRDVVAGR